MTPWSVVALEFDEARSRAGLHVTGGPVDARFRVEYDEAGALVRDELVTSLLRAGVPLPTHVAVARVLAEPGTLALVGRDPTEVEALEVVHALLHHEAWMSQVAS